MYIRVMWVPVTMPWLVCRLQMEAVTSRYGGWWWKYWISTFRQLTRGGHPSLGLGKGLTTHCKRPAFYEMLHRGLLCGSCEHGNELLDTIKVGYFLTVW